MTDNRGLRYGIYAGLSVVAVFVLLYLVNKDWYFNPFVFWATVGVYLAFGWKALEDERQAAGGKLPFQDGLKVAFLIFVVANLIYYVFHYLLMTVVDPEMPRLQQELALQTLEDWRETLPEDQYLERKKNLQDPNSTAVTLQGAALQYASSLIGYFLLSMIMAGVVSRK